VKTSFKVVSVSISYARKHVGVFARHTIETVE